MSRRGGAAFRWSLVIATTVWGTLVPLGPSLSSARDAFAAPPVRSPLEPPPIEVPPIPALAPAVAAPALGASMENGNPENPAPSAWRRVALVSATAAAGVALAAGTAATYIATEKTTEFNTRRAPPAEDAAMLGESCGVELPGAGPPGCAELLSEREQALRWGRIGFAAAGVFALTALVLKLSEPETPDRSRPRLSCAAAVGRGGCAITF